MLTYQACHLCNLLLTFVGEPKGSAPSPLSVCQNATLKRSLCMHIPGQHYRLLNMLCKNINVATGTGVFSHHSFMGLPMITSSAL